MLFFQTHMCMTTLNYYNVSFTNEHFHLHVNQETAHKHFNFHALPEFLKNCVNHTSIWLHKSNHEIPAQQDPVQREASSVCHSYCSKYFRVTTEEHKQIYSQ